ncbi:hypothetical protein BJ912DRAFT_1056999 [Pholiota molesta]|nr:hypothetical protein BJ912DRAFT_1056999 [Pholiota molesta]
MRTPPTVPNSCRVRSWMQPPLPVLAVVGSFHVCARWLLLPSLSSPIIDASLTHARHGSPRYLSHRSAAHNAVWLASITEGKCHTSLLHRNNTTTQNTSSPVFWHFAHG